MKKILLTVLILLLGWLAYFTVTQGVTMGDFRLLSVTQIQNKNDTLDQRILELNGIVTKEFPNKIAELQKAVTTLKDTKQQYVEKTASYTEEQILAATQENQYYIEYMWAKVGNHARNEGVKINMEIVLGDTAEVNNLNFTVEGTYIATTEFIYAVENDTELNFRVKNFKMLPMETGDILKTTFVVKNVKILGNTSGQIATTNSILETDKNP